MEVEEEEEEQEEEEEEVVEASGKRGEMAGKVREVNKR
jgi:hypothetical protein